jgi:hypothetical protein
MSQFYSFLQNPSPEREIFLELNCAETSMEIGNVIIKQLMPK